MIQNIALIGGDLRIVKLAILLADDGININTYALEGVEEFNGNNRIKKCSTLEDAVKNIDIIIGPIPLSKNNNELNTPYSVKKINIEEFADCINSKVLIAGSITKEIVRLFEDNNCKVIDLLGKEELAILNTISTAEGAIQLAMENTKKTIYKSNVLILGFGRVGKTTAERFKALHANVYCEARKKSDIAWIKTFGYNAIYLNELEKYLDRFDIIINTIPTEVLNEEYLKYIRKECLIIDLASSPGGVDFKTAKDMGINAFLALALPGKVAPVTSAEFIKDVLDEIIKEI